MKSGLPPLCAATAAITVVTALNREGRLPLSALAPTPQSFGSGRVWLVATSVFVADRPAAASIGGLFVVGLAVLALCGSRVLWLSAAFGHVGSAVTVYGAMALARAVHPDAFAVVDTLFDYGTSAVIAAWVGALAVRLWGRDPRLAVVLSVGSGLIGWLLRPDITVLDTEHLVAFALGAAIAGYGSSWVFRRRLKPATVSAPLSTSRHIQP
jgi:hypothetical protein